MLVLLTGLVILAIILASLTSMHEEGRSPVTDRHLITKTGVCPPFHLYAEDGSLIDPVHGINGYPHRAITAGTGALRLHCIVTFHQRRMSRLPRWICMGDIWDPFSRLFVHLP